MRNIQFAIPSLGRPDRVYQQTVKTLTQGGVPLSLITIFVASEEEKDAYSASNPNVNLVVGELGIGNQRTFINSHYEEGTAVVSLDDDVTLVQKDESKIKPYEGELLLLVNKFFDACDKYGLKYWGVPETTNGFFMKHQHIVGLRKCAGSFYGEYAQIPETQSRRGHCEDVEKVLLHYKKFGGILRIDDLSPKQTFFSEGGVIEHYGGLDKRREAYRQHAEDLSNLYPDLVAFNPNPKKGGLFEKVKLKTSHRGGSLL